MKHPPVVWGIVVFAAVGACSHQERYGRDPEKLKEAPVRQDQREIELARSAAMKEERQPESIEDVSPVSVLFINNEPLTVEDVLKWIRYDLQRMAAELKPEEYMQKLIETARAEVRSRAEGILLNREARAELSEQDLERLEDFVDGRIRDLINTEHGGRQTRYEDWLLERGITPAEDRDRIRREMLIVAYLQRTVGQRVAEMTRRELERYYEQYVASIEESRRRRMSLIDIPYGEMDVTGRRVSAPVPKEDARRRARRAKEKLAEGETFAEVARTYSEGVNAYACGEWGWISRDGVKPRWIPAVEALYRLQDGQVSEIIEGEGALFIVKCDEIEPLEPKSFAEMQVELTQSYKNHQFDLLTRELINELYEDASIRPENPGRFLRAVVEAAPRPRGAG